MRDQQLLDELGGLFDDHLDRSVFDNPQLLLDAICGASAPNVGTLDLRIAQLLYAGASEARQQRIQLTLSRLRSSEEERYDGLLQKCKCCRSLLSILPLGLLVAAVQHVGSIERLASVNLRAPSLLQVFKDHPLIEKATRKQTALRILAGVVALAARVDHSGGDPYDFGEKLARRLSKARESPRPAAVRAKTHRGGTRRRKTCDLSVQPQRDCKAGEPMNSPRGL